MPNKTTAILKQTINAIKNNKLLFFISVIIQILFVGLLFYLSVDYTNNVFEKGTAIENYVNSLEINDSFMENLIEKKSFLGENPDMIDKNFGIIRKNIAKFLIYLSLTVIILGSLNWDLASYISKKERSFGNFLKDLIKNILFVAVLYFIASILMFLAFQNIDIENFLIEQKEIIIIAIALLITFIAAYFIQIALALDLGLKDKIKKCFEIGLGKWKRIMLAHIINIIIIGIFLFIAYSFFDNGIFMFVLSLIAIIYIIFSRIFLIILYREL